MTRNMHTEYVSEAERAQMRRLIDKGIAPSIAQAAALLNEIDRLQGRRNGAAVEPEAKDDIPSCVREMIRDLSACEHAYPSPWFGIVPPSCLKCGR